MHCKGSSWSALRRGRVLVGTLTLAATAAAGILAASAMPAFAGGGNGHGGGKGGGNSNAGSHVTICHRTGSHSNPYVQISPDVSGVFHGHYSQHNENAIFPNTAADGKWGDIIPPFTYRGTAYAGLNWTDQGQAIWNNGCQAPSGGATTTTGGTTTSGSQTVVTTTTTVATTTTTAASSLGLKVQKLERVGTTGGFSTGPVAAAVGDTIFYEIVVTNTSSVALDVTLSDPRCDAGTLLPSGSVPQHLVAGAEKMYTCSHVLKSTDGSVYFNVATANGYSSSVKANVSASSRVRANVSAGGVAGAHKTVTKKVTHKARPTHAAVKGASFTG